MSGDSFSDWTRKLAEALCVENGIPCKRQFTDMELERPRAEVRQAKADRYADAMIKRDELERARPEHDFTTRGTPLKGAP